MAVPFPSIPVDLAFLRRQSVDTLARWADTLNGWDWPDDLPGKPEGFDDLPDAVKPEQKEDRRSLPNKMDLITGISEGIDFLITRREQLRYHHLNNLKRSEEEFESWWNEVGKDFPTAEEFKKSWN